MFYIPKLLSDKNCDTERRINDLHAFHLQIIDVGQQFLDCRITTEETWIHDFDPEIKQRHFIRTVKRTVPPLQIIW